MPDILVMDWTGPSGRVWDFNSEHLWVTEKGLIGLGHPQIQHHTLPRHGHGDWWTGWRVSGRQVVWPLATDGLTAAEWLAQDQALWADLHPGVEGIWGATLLNGQRRELACRFESDGPWSMSDDPLLFLRQDYEVTLRGAPFWLGEVIPRRWETAGYQGPWLLGPGGGGVARFASGSNMGTAEVTNPGDVEAWPEWTITGPCTSWTVGVGGRTVTSTRTLLAGEVRRLITDAGFLRLLDGSGSSTAANGDPLTKTELGKAEWQAIPAGQDVALTVQMTGTGSVQAEFRPRYFRAL